MNRCMKLDRARCGSCLISVKTDASPTDQSFKRFKPIRLSSSLLKHSHISSLPDALSLSLSFFFFFFLFPLSLSLVSALHLPFFELM